MISRDMCNEMEERYVQIAEIEENLRYTYDWRGFFAKNLRYKKPFCLNSQMYTEMPSRDGTVPEEDRFLMGDVMSDTSEEPDS